MLVLTWRGDARRGGHVGSVSICFVKMLYVWLYLLFCFVLIQLCLVFCSVIHGLSVKPSSSSNSSPSFACLSKGPLFIYFTRPSSNRV